MNTVDEEFKLMVVCLSCGHQGTRTFSDRATIPDVSPCQKCSNDAYVLHPMRTRIVIMAMAKEIVRLKMDMIDCQTALEDV